jgi:hypothetical protein
MLDTKIFSFDMRQHGRRCRVAGVVKQHLPPPPDLKESQRENKEKSTKYQRILHAGYSGVRCVRVAARLRHKVSSLPSTQGSWVPIPLRAWMSVYAFILCVGSGLATG